MAQLPLVIKNNNDAISREFDTIRNSDGVMILDVSTDNITSKSAHFVNLDVNQLNIVDSSGGQNLAQYINTIINNSPVVASAGFSRTMLSEYSTDVPMTYSASQEPEREYDMTKFFSATVSGKMSGITTADLYRIRMYRKIDEIKIPLSVCSAIVGKKLRLCLYHDHIEKTLTYQKVSRVFVAVVNNPDGSGLLQYGPAETIDLKNSN